MAENSSDPGPGSAYDFSMIAGLSDTEKVRMCIALLCHKNGPAARNIDTAAAAAGMGAASGSSFAKMYGNLLKKISKGDATTPKATPKKSRNPKKSAKATEDDGDGDSDTGEEDPDEEKAKSATPKPKRARKSASANGSTPVKKVKVEPKDDDADNNSDDAEGVAAKFGISPQK
ncbi:hypothetical protein K490DRAFT_69084 [Saccharata proteae CBS 121410]|uniref:Uncharacterized protein n=1 Tax=Saccharata proteae CBS 121410 TaxID=1314787 RepID=A0A9P4HP82_9PEZI|nr:hypothetical protein K490DRAFT_69084 [Saccharata proteae CBS 121410]